MKAQKEHVFLVLTNKSTEPVLSLFKKISNEIKQIGDCFLLYHRNQSFSLPSQIDNIPNHIFTDEILIKLKYKAISNKLLPGSNHFPLLDFFLKNSSYSFYWLIEDDVRFNGNWTTLFNEFNNLSYDFDFISSHLTDYNDDPDWPWWKTLFHKDLVIPFDKRLRSFNPIYCLSKSALQFLHEMLLNGWSGHHEVLMPTLLKLSGGKLIDFGGEGKYVLSGFENKFYLNEKISNLSSQINLSSMRFRPTMLNVGPTKNILYHPVKGNI